MNIEIIMKLNIYSLWKSVCSFLSSFPGIEQTLKYIARIGNNFGCHICSFNKVIIYTLNSFIIGMKKRDEAELLSPQQNNRCEFKWKINQINLIIHGIP